ncbi:MOSC domain-containing protein [Alteraurantiacibacter aestuarii]|uniref:MOSC domain-containing protein n=1 Tax=Alteraurantiacibacter aestuarii TaxID=650004 RepID=A0A844ZID1_9SPHN|nr:MOSC domain-containing protein [Alteraurantiacibacter aestuarii]MXO87203.1 MOSC domain-containing protein [Alteraurantiacibacter aestuarii]
MADESGNSGAEVVAVAASIDHRFSKQAAPGITIIAGLGVQGDAHAGERVQHRSRVAANPDQPNLRQLHLIHAELFDWLETHGFAIGPGMLGENIATRGIALLDLPLGTLLHIGDDVVLEVTGLRNPCAQIEAFRPGLLSHLARKQPDGAIERLAGIMCVAIAGGTVQPGDAIVTGLPEKPHMKLGPV